MIAEGREKSLPRIPIQTGCLAAKPISGSGEGVLLNH
jgi:hypothetical protein